MKFSEFCQYEKKDPDLERICRSADRHVKRFIQKQIVSIGDPKRVRFDELTKTVVSPDREIRLRIAGERVGDKIKIRTLIDGESQVAEINPEYFKSENIRAYLREFEIQAGQIFREIRKSIRS